MKFRSILTVAVASTLIVGCGGSSDDPTTTDLPTVVPAEPIDMEPVIVTPGEPVAQEPVEIDPVTTPVIMEPIGPTGPVGDSLFEITEGQSLIVQLALEETDDIQLTFPSEFDAENISASIDFDDGAAIIDIELDYDEAPIQVQDRVMTITGTQGDDQIAMTYPFHRESYFCS